MMDSQEKSFRDLQQDERLKKLERHLKLTQIKRPNSSQLPSSPHMSISGISSIHGDNLLSDFSFCSPSISSSKAGSVILASSINLRKKLAKNLKTGSSVLSACDQNLNELKIAKDRAMMPPPPVISGQKPLLSVDMPQKGHAVNFTTKASFSQSHESQSRSTHSLQETSSSNRNVPIENKALNQASKNNDMSKQYARQFKNWIVRLNDHGEIIIKGRIESGEQARSKAVKKRLSAAMVLSVLNHKYRLVGDIHDVRGELPEWIRGKFYNGFPTDWENVRQIWQGYVASGFSSQFRWPRPVADSDDDLRSDITDLTVIHSENTKTKPIPFIPASISCQTTRESESRSRKRENHSQSKKIIQGSDISPVHSVANEDSDVSAEPSPTETSCKNTAEKTSAVTNNHLIDHNKSASKIVKPNELKSLKCGSAVPRWKVDIIVDNLMNKNCSKDYIDKFIRAMDCFNELLTMPSLNTMETLPGEGMSLNNNFNTQTDNHVVLGKARTLKISDSTRLQQSKQAKAAPTNSYSLESSEESVEESRSKHNTYVRKPSVKSRKNDPVSQTLIELRQSQSPAAEPRNFLNYSDANGGQNGSTLSREPATVFDTRNLKNKESQNIAKLPKEEIGKKSVETVRYKRKASFNSTDSDTEIRVLNKARIIPPNESSIITTTSRRALDSKYPYTATEKMNDRVADGAFCDSDVSIVDASVAPVMKGRVLSIEKIAKELSQCIHQRETLRPDFSFNNNENNDHSEVNSPMPRTSRKPNKQILNASSAKTIEQCTVRLTKVAVDQHNSSTTTCTHSKPEKTATERRKNKIDACYQTNERPESDSENINMRMSSRGRRILPPLDYWNGERVTLKGRELIYSPGSCRPASLSAYSSVLKQSLSSPNGTAVSEPTLAPAPARNSNRTVDNSIDHSKSTLDSGNKNTKKLEGILTEITSNSDDHAMKRITRTSLHNMKTDVRKNRRIRNANVNFLNSSSEDEKTKVVRSRKKRRLH